MEILVICIAVVVAIIMVYTASCFMTIPLNVSYLILQLERPVKVVSGTWIILWKPIQRFIPYPKQQQGLDVPIQTFLSADKKVDSVHYPVVEIKTSGKIFYTLPTDLSGLVAIYRLAPDFDNDKHALDDLLRSAFVAILRESFGKLSYAEIVHDIIQEGECLVSLNDFLLKMLKESDNPLIKHLTDIKFSLSMADLPEKYKLAMLTPGIAKLDRQARKEETKAEVYNITQTGKATIVVRRAMAALLQEDGGVQAETFHTLRQMAQGNGLMFWNLPKSLLNIFQSAGIGPDSKELKAIASNLTTKLEN